MIIVVAMKALNLGVIFELALQLSPISDVSVVSCYGVESPLAHALVFSRLRRKN